MCSDVLDSPMLLPCGHSACESCIFAGVEQEVVFCPVGCGLHKPDDVFLDETKRAAAEELRVLCRWATHVTTDGAGLRFARDGCRVDMRVSSRHRHEGECPLRLEPCGFVDDTDPSRPLGCPASVQHQTLPHHRRGCPFRTERCRRCRQRVVVRSRLLHERTCTVRDCPFFCGVAVREDALMRHVAEDCAEAPVTCGFVDDGGGAAGAGVASSQCHHTCRRTDLEVHQRDCDFRPTPCEHCERDVARRRGVAHAAVCEEGPMPCPNECGQIIRRGDVKYHCYSDCPEQTVPCTLRHFGCVARHLRAAAPDHMAENAGGHVALVAAAVEALQTKTQEQSMQILAMRAEMDAMRLAHARDTALVRAEMDSARALHAAEALTTQSELDDLREGMKESLDSAASTAKSWSAHDADYARRMYAEFHFVRRLLDSQAHERVNETRELRLTMQTVSMKLQDETDEARKKAIEVSARTKEELQPALTAVQAEVVDVKASMREDQFEHQTKITRLSQEVDTLRAVIHNILSETTVDHFWPERRVVLANAHAGGGGLLPPPARGGKGGAGLGSSPPRPTSANQTSTNQTSTNQRSAALGVSAWESDARPPSTTQPRGVSPSPKHPPHRRG